MRLLLGLLLVVACVFKLSLEPQNVVAGGGEEAAFVGTQNCKKCHLKQWKSWKETKMAKAFELLQKGVAVEVKAKHGLEDKDYTQDEKCLKCHTVGYSHKSGYQVVTDASDKEALEDAQQRQGIGCESCHGPGEHYSPYMKEHKKTKDYKQEEALKLGLCLPDKEVCVKCHNAESPTVAKDYVFDYEKYMKEGIHEHFEKGGDEDEDK